MILLSLMTGLAVGMSGSLHCAGVCGAIVCSVGTMLKPAGGGLRQQLAVQGMLHGGRIFVQSIAGGLVGAAGTSVVSLAGDHTALNIAHVASSAMLLWSGLSLLGLVPRPAFLHRTGGGRLRLRPGTSALVMGMGWGLMPCGMVYGALLLALFTADAANGAATMLGFGIGTMPALLSVFLGMRGMRKAEGRSSLRRPAAYGLIALALVTLSIPVPNWPDLCGQLGFAS
ncbi:MAG: hypothetical protein DI547_14885 [Sphingobium sp.]|nr:MAG: hypothetical protein DI547_14885 [Sphingobium sp.]